VGSILACPWLALVTGVGAYVLAGIEIEVMSRTFVHFRRGEDGGQVCACIRAFTHSDCLGSRCEPRRVTDTWRARSIQID